MAELIVRECGENATNGARRYPIDHVASRTPYASCATVKINQLLLTSTNSEIALSIRVRHRQTKTLCVEYRLSCRARIHNPSKVRRRVRQRHVSARASRVCLICDSIEADVCDIDEDFVFVDLGVT